MSTMIIFLKAVGLVSLCLIAIVGLIISVMIFCATIKAAIEVSRNNKDD